MSAWRRVAMEKIPRYRKLIERAEGIGMLWVDLWLRFVRAHSDPIDEELIRQIYDYAWWCVSSPDPNTATAAALSSYEHLPKHPKVREQMARWLTAEEFSGMEELSRHHRDSDKEFKQFVRDLYEHGERLRQEALRSECLTGRRAMSRMILDDKEKAMVELEIQDALRNDLVAVAERRRTHPRALAEHRNGF